MPAPTLPSPETIVGLQLLVRGPLFILLCLLLTRIVGRAASAWCFCCCILFTVLWGIRC
jgi:hypothetical protein